MKASLRFFLIVIVLIHAAWFAGSLFLNSYMNNDSQEYITQAYNLIRHGSFYAANWDQWPHLPEYYSMRPPGYSLLVLITMVITNNAFVLLFAQAVISVMIWMKLRKVILKYLPEIEEKKVHWFLIIALLLNPIQLILCNSIFSEILFQCLLTLGFFFFLDFLEQRQLRSYWLFLGCFTLALLTKPVLVYFAYVNIFIVAFLYIKIKRNSWLLASALLMPLVILLVSLNNQRHTGYFQYSSSKVFNLWAYNTTNFLNMKYGHDSGFVYKSEIYKQSLSRPEFKDQYGFMDSACSHVLIKNISSYLPFHAQGVINFFIAPGREFMNDYLNRKEDQPMSFIKEINVHGWDGFLNYVKSQSILLLLIHALVTCWNVLLLGGLVAFTFSKKVPLNIKVIALIILLYFAGVSSLALGAARYKAAIYPILLFCNAFVLLKKSKPINSQT